MTKPDYVYVTYIATTPQKAWQALVDTDMMREWWVDPVAGCARVNVSDWRPGSRWEHTRADGSGTVDIVGKVVESTPPRRLVFTWARPGDAEDDAKHSRVTFDVEPYGKDLVRLTVTHDELAGDLQMLEGISGGWPKVLSNLKTFLESGRGLPRSGPAT
ncbi:MAG: SRPBCC family protein [Burkholderiales bacterium]|nr:SRPBCC family protein [Burkholderiales bacterium]